MKLLHEDTALAALHDVRAMLALVDDGKVSVGEKTGQVSLPGPRRSCRSCEMAISWLSNKAISRMSSGRCVPLLGPCCCRPANWRR